MVSRSDIFQSRALSFFFLSLVLFSQPSLADVSLRSIYARNYELKQVVEKTHRASVFVFFKVGCPAVDLLASELTSLYLKYKEKNIGFVAVYSSAGLNLREVQMHAQQFDVPFRVFLDTDQELAKKWKVQRTAESVLVNPQFEILYQGAVSDARINGADGQYLVDALNAFLAGDSIKVTSTKSQGCLINTKKLPPLKDVTWHKDILPIFQAKCQKCHRPGEIGPMSLLNYKSASNNASMISEVVEDRIMPPWPAESPLKIKEDHRLTDLEVRKILSWVENDTPEGVESDGPKPIVWPSPEQWTIGKPDAIYDMKPYTIPARGLVPYIYTRIPLNFKEDTFITALEIKPGSRKVVHHIAVHEFPYSEKAVTPADILKMKGLELSDEILGAFVPGMRPRILKPGEGIRIKKGMGLLLEAHYTPYGKEVTDISKVGFKFLREPLENEMRCRWFYRSRGRFLVPKHTEHHKMMRDDISFDEDVEIMGLRPHLHARGKSFLVEKVWLDEKSGKEMSEVLLSIPRWDFNWQMDYFFEKPWILKGGESIRMTGVWDNTKWNPTNPNPDVDVNFGEQTEQEMMGTLVHWRKIK